MGKSVDVIIAGYDPNRPLTTASTPPSSWYTDSSVFELEQPTVFSHTWQFIGRTEQVRDPGQYICCEIAGAPILVVKGNDNVPRGFFNVCRHHAAAIMTKPEGKEGNLRCPYHGWTYDLTGALIHTPEKTFDVPPAHERRVTDPTGCGDAFRAGLIFGIEKGYDWMTIGRIGNLMGALKVEHPGTQNQRFDYEEFAEQFKQQFGYAL